MNFGTLGTGFGGMGRGGGGQSLGPLLSRIAAGRVDFIGIGDSNQLLGSTGWDHGFQYALSQRFSMYATGIISLNENAGDGGGIGYGFNYNASAPVIGVMTGAPSFFDDQMSPGSGAGPTPNAYAYLADGDSVATGTNSGFQISGTGHFDVTDAIDVDLYNGTFAAGTGSFGMLIRRDSSPFTTYASLSSVNPVTGADGMRHTRLSLTANSARAGLTLGVRYTNGNIEGPFFGMWGRASRPAVTNGFSYHTLYGLGGQSLRDMAYDCQQMSDTTLDNFLQEAIYLQGATHTVVICVNAGLNDRNETETSVGTGAVTDGDSAEAYVDNLAALRARIEARWVAIGEDLADLFWIVFPSHVVSDPDDSELLSYRAATEDYISTWPRAYFIDFSTLMTSAEGVANSWYASGGADKSHLTQAGYESLSARIFDRITSQ